MDYNKMSPELHEKAKGKISVVSKVPLAVMGTGRSDFPNQINNVLAFPGIFRGALDAGAREINCEMKIAAAVRSGAVRAEKPQN